MARATFNGVVIAESDQTVIVEGNHYFPREAVKEEYLLDSDHSTVCGWKGDASYHTIEVDGVRTENAAWYYAEPLDGAQQIRGRVAFWNGVEVTD